MHKVSFATQPGHFLQLYDTVYVWLGVALFGLQNGDNGAALWMCSLILFADCIWIYEHRYRVRLCVRFHYAFSIWNSMLGTHRPSFHSGWKVWKYGGQSQVHLTMYITNHATIWYGAAFRLRVALKAPTTGSLFPWLYMCWKWFEIPCLYLCNKYSRLFVMRRSSLYTLVSFI